MAEPPPEALLRLREADVVRLCGLAAAARGLALVDRHAVIRGRRDGARLSGVVHDSRDARPTDAGADAESRAGRDGATWVEIAPTLGAIDAAGWGCGYPGDMTTIALDTVRPGLACAHVAALLTAWIRRPGDFAAGVAPDARQRQGAPGARRPDESTAASARPGGATNTTTPLTTGHADARARAPGAAEPTTGRLGLAEELRRLADAERVAVARRVLGTEMDASPGAGDVVEATDPHALTARLASALADSAFTGHLLARLDERVVDLLRGMIYLENAATDADLRGVAERSDLGRSAVDTAVEVLARHGLAFRARAGTGDEARARGSAGWVIPPEVAAAVGRTVPVRALAVAGERGPPWLPPADGQPARAARVQPGMARQVCAAAALLARAPGPVGLADGFGATRASRRTPRDLGRRAGGPRTRPPPPLPGEPADAEIAAWAHAAQLPAHLVRMTRRLLPRAQAAGGFAPALGDLGRLPAAEWPLALRAAFQVWLGAETRDELLDLGDEGADVRVRCDPTHAGLRPATLDGENAAARRRVVAAVSRLPGGAWVAVEDLLGVLWRLDPFFLRGRQRAFEEPAWWIEETSSGRRLRADVRAEWGRAEGRYVTDLLVGPLHWWGVVELASDPRQPAGSMPYACRVAPLGAYLLGMTDDPPAHAETLAHGWGPAALPARGAMLALQPLAAGSAALDQLSPWTEVTGVAGGRLIVRPSADRAARELDAGRAPDAALACLCALDGQDGTHAAGVFEGAVRAWRVDYGAARIAIGMVPLGAADEAALREALATVPEIANRCRVVAPTLALVPAADVDSLRQALNRRGFVL